MENLYSKKTSKYDYASVNRSDSKYYVTISRTSGVISVNEVIEILSSCVDETTESPSRRIVDVVYRSYYRDDKTPKSSTPSVIDDPVFDAQSYTFLPVPIRPDYPEMDIVVGWEELRDECGKSYPNWIFYIEPTLREDGILYLDALIEFDASAEEMRCLIEILKKLRDNLPTRKE